MKYLRFRELVTTEEGLRAEAPTQTALTSLWRNRKTGARACRRKMPGVRHSQFPKQDVCVNPACVRVGSQDDYEFADVTATVKSFTGDALAVSPDPPAIYGMVEFEGGGRFIADFTDCVAGRREGRAAREDGLPQARNRQGARLHRLLLEGGPGRRAEVLGRHDVAMATGIRDKVVILGMGCSRFGERWDVGAEQLMVEAFEEALPTRGSAATRSRWPGWARTRTR